MKTLVLDDERIVETVARLQRRIDDRFPDAGLSKLCGQLLDVARQASERSAWIAKPILWIRAISYGMATALVALLIGLVVYASGEVFRRQLDLINSVEELDAGMNHIIFLSIGIVFLISLETRIKRRRALAAIHELRSIAHVIDMHQLTKDPERSLRSWAKTKNSPKQSMTSFELHRYLDYCSEMLSLTGKIAALYVQHFDDADAVAAVSELEQLSTGLSRKIWQKIMILHQSREATENLEQAADEQAANEQAEKLTGAFGSSSERSQSPAGDSAETS